MSEVFTALAQLATASWQKKLAYGVILLAVLAAALAALKEASGYTFRDLAERSKPSLSPDHRQELQKRVRMAAADGAISADEATVLREHAATLGHESVAGEAYLAESQSSLIQAAQKLRKGNELVGQGKMEEARSYFREATALDAGNSEAWSNFGGAALELGSLAEAEAALNKALAIEGDSIIANYNMAACLAGQGRTEAAFGRLERAIERLADRDKIFESKAIRQDMQTNQHFSALRTSPRFEALLRRMP